MTAPTGIQKAYLPTTRQFPGDLSILTGDLSKNYIDIAQAINFRVIGIFDKFQVVTGERWFNDADNLSKRQTYRQVYSVPAIAIGGNGLIAHGLTGVTSFTRIYGTAYLSSNFNVPLPYASELAATDNIAVKIGPTNIIIDVGATSAGSIVRGIIVLEYLLN